MSLKRIFEIEAECKNISAKSSIAMQRFTLAADTADGKQMDTFRAELHSLLDQQLDLLSEAADMKISSQEALLKKLTNPKR